MTEQPQPQPEETQAPSSIASRKRVRASVACNHCRAKRSKCDGLPGQRSCTQCKQRAIECEMPSKKRNRGHYKPQAEALMRRVQMLEVALAEGQATASSFSALQVPVSLMDRTSTQWLHPMPDSNPSVLSEVVDDFSSAALSCPSGTSLSLTFESLNSAEASGPKPTAAQPSQPSGHSSGTNDNSSFKWAASNPPPHHSPHSNPPPPSSLMLRPTSSGQELDPLNVPPPVVDYLLGLFFHKFQLMLKFISQREFMAGMDPTTGETPPPRSLLLAVLAGALRYATRSEVITAYIRPDGENVLATAAKKAFESEVYSRDISTVQTLLILAEVEIDSGNEMSGFIYSSMASKLLFELSLDLASCSTTELTDEQIEVRHWLTWIASVQDQYWAILLQRPLTIKTHVLGMSRLAAAFARSAAVISAEPSFEAQVHESLLDLMELAREVTDALYESGPPRPTSNMYATIDQLDHRIKNWFSRLPERIARGPFSSGGGDKYYFLLVLHLHLSVTQIVLHRHRAFPPNMYDSPDSYPASDFADEEASGRSRSRETVASAAVQIAKIFEMLRHREDIRQLQSTGLQWATLAAQALTNHLQTLPANELVEGPTDPPARA
ncbi:hypothetical protein SODALDRAFT_185986 [Sodiomyces alkalinus F11]|uniref:Zn(2)-C6 fungal-type domain-containing protein n=1 Tax=Sodiomyces alkalinus (strain CBS 110278 / VKM F-3762 / F11) TaxID=1314773 RepID=A0A3N2PUX8_SODAK|nr:hypothetical protein SODALDRAFT_185986 [Sodiomyces alkalinus F11]ROT38301.1 hypothetical protein SODALDRAFT_185986 [Sodiomyces alkalinus F11]